jgi:hypothetical protein
MPWYIVVIEKFDVADPEENRPLGEDPARSGGRLLRLVPPLASTNSGGGIT